MRGLVCYSSYMGRFRSANVRPCSYLGLGLPLSLVVASCLPHDEDLGRKTTARAAAEDDDAIPSPDTTRSPTASAAERKLATMKKKAEQDLLLSEPFEDTFERLSAGPNWRLTGAGWRLSDGRLCGERARNHPAWLARKLPPNALVEFDALSHSPDGDIKVEVFGDGARFAAGVSYTDATSYLAIFGGWKNSLHVLARLDEHGEDRKAVTLEADSASARERKVVPEQVYRFRLERRDGKTLSWSVDGEKIHEFEDDEPLMGDGHDHFGFNDWEARVCFDNLRVTPL